MRTPNGTQAQVIVLALWLGAAIFVATVVAPAAFASLPSRALAGAVIGRVLPALFYAGICAGIAVALLDWRAVDAIRVTGRASAGLVLAAACAVAQFIIGARIATVRASIGGSLDALPADDARRVAFGRLHGFSVLWLGVATMSAFVALVLSVRARRVVP